MFRVLSIWLLSIIASQGVIVINDNLPTLELINPRHSSSVAVIPPQNHADIPVNFIVDDRGGDYKACLSLLLEDTTVFPEQCLDTTHNSFTVSNLNPGKYNLHVVLSNNSQSSGNSYIEESRVVSTFHVLTMEEALPSLRLPPRLQFLANGATDASDVPVDIELTNSPINRELDICIQVNHFDGSGAVLERTCIPSNQPAITLYSVPSGKYNVLAELQQRGGPKTPFPSSSCSTEVEIIRLQDALPSVSLPVPVLEFGVPAEGGTVEEAHLPVSVEVSPAYPWSLGHLDCCLTFYFHSASENPLKYCVAASDALHFSMRGLEVGKHTFTVGLRSKREPHRYYKESERSGEVEVRHPEEFIPSYEWQPLRAWHTIPSGLETRLPVGSAGGVKQARIPEPWRLQLSMPHPCKFFLRADIDRSTTIASIKEKASANCDLPAQCFELEAEGVSLSDSDTVESTELFLKSPELNINSENPDCIIP